jgi:hypothetical protein
VRNGSDIEPAIGTPFVGRDRELPDRLGEAARSGLIVTVPGALGRHQFSHDLIREMLHIGLPPGRWARLHRRIGDTLEAMDRAAPDTYLAELCPGTDCTSVRDPLSGITPVQR